LSEKNAFPVTSSRATSLDRIDELVTPGTTINPADGGYDNPALQTAARRR
jgi:hypothetical protein